PNRPNTSAARAERIRANRRWRMGSSEKHRTVSGPARKVKDRAAARSCTTAWRGGCFGAFRSCPRREGLSIDVRGPLAAGVVQPDRLQVGEEVRALLGHFLLPDPRRLDSAERQLRLAPHGGLVHVQ